MNVSSALFILTSVSASVALPYAASGHEVTLRGITSFAEGTQFSKNFERFIEKVNTDGKGIIQINYIGDPRNALLPRSCTSTRRNTDYNTAW